MGLKEKSHENNLPPPLVSTRTFNQHAAKNRTTNGLHIRALQVPKPRQLTTDAANYNYFKSNTQLILSLLTSSGFTPLQTATRTLSEPEYWQ